ncbi:MAG: hypothetical protein BIFFINMI_03996 [Phycisphaerae bacterium]|nr:hypothetical protein [Phycisphaerae bacterium]
MSDQTRQNDAGAGSRPVVRPRRQVHPGVEGPPDPPRPTGLPPFLGRTRRGFSSVLATFYLILFSGLAVAYAAMSGSNAEVSGNTRGDQVAYTAAESGLSVLRYHMAGLTFAGRTTSDEVFQALGEQLAATFDGTMNAGTQHVQYDGSRIVIPSISTDSSLPGSTFAATITRDGANYVLTVTGDCHGIDRRLQLTLAEANAPGSGGFPTHGIISRGSIDINGSAVLRSNVPGGSSVMSLDADAWQPIHVNGSGQYDGDFYTVKAGVEAGDIFNGSHRFLNAETGQYETDADAHVHAGITEPTWPEVDTETFANLITALPHTVVNSNQNGVQDLHNVLIPANSNVRFNGTTTINGLVYVEWPNDIRFNGSLNITGMIVFEKPPFEPDVNAEPTNSLTFNGSINARGPDNLPDTAEYAGLRDKLHTFLLAPDTGVTFNGAFGNVVGSIYTSSLRMNGATSGTIRGSIIVDRRLEFSKNGSMNVYFEVQEGDEDMAGLQFPSNKVLKVVPSSYAEP